MMDIERIMDRLPALLGVRRDPSKTPSAVMLPLRFFFGATFVYAGLQKLTDPQFFSPTAPGFIGHQLGGFVRAGSPLSGILNTIAIPHATVFGALIAFCEVWIGLSALFGLLTRFGAPGGQRKQRIGRGSSIDVHCHGLGTWRHELRYFCRQCCAAGQDPPGQRERVGGEQRGLLHRPSVGRSRAAHSPG
jgi:uncharacterized membrane protein YphA (DoxX/SURF4 family)